jgi:5-methylcytosine-specific restriction endonuclease McrA
MVWEQVRVAPASKPRQPSGASARRAARSAAAPGFATAAQLDARWAYYQGRCWMCRQRADHMDHVKPLARGGSNWPANQRPACWPCNKAKNVRWPFLPALTRRYV